MSRKRKKANEAVPEEILAEGSGPTQDAESLAEAASEALANAPQPSPSDDEDVVFDAKSSKPRRAKRTEVTSDEPILDDVTEAEAEPEPELEAAAEPKRKRSRRREVISDELAVEAALAPDDAAIEAAVLDTEVGPELEEALLEAEQTAQADEQVLEDAVMRAEAEAELGTAEPEAEAGEEDIELGAALPTTAATMDDVQLKHLVEALIFAADKPVTMQRLRQLTRISDVKRLEQALAILAEDFAARGIALQQVSGGYQFRTNTQYSTWVQQLIAGRPVRLSRAQLETLAIIAYRQPITRPEVDEIRGVDSSATLRLLMDRSLIRILGKKEDVGRPLLYGTTKEFLDFFSLGDLRELPTLREYSELSAESRKVMSDRLGVGLDGTVEGEEGDEAGGELGDDEARSVEGADATVDDLVREFAEQDLSAHVGAEPAAPDDAAMSADDAAMSPSDNGDVSSSDDVAVFVSDDDAMSLSTDVSLSDAVEPSALSVTNAEATEAAVEAAEEPVAAATDEAVVEAIEATDEPVAAASAEPAVEAVQAGDEAVATASDEEVKAAIQDVVGAEEAILAATDVAAIASVEEPIHAGAPEREVMVADDPEAADGDTTVAADTNAAENSDQQAAADVSAPDSLDSTDEPPTD